MATMDTNRPAARRRRTLVVAAGAGLAFWLAAAPASAQWFGGFEAERPIPPQGIVRMLMGRGFSGITRPRFDGEVYTVEGINRSGERVRLTIDAFDGDIVGRTRLAHAGPPDEESLVPPRDVGRGRIEPDEPFAPPPAQVEIPRTARLGEPAAPQAPRSEPPVRKPPATRSPPRPSEAAPAATPPCARPGRRGAEAPGSEHGRLRENRGGPGRGACARHRRRHPAQSGSAGSGEAGLPGAGGDARNAAPVTPERRPAKRRRIAPLPEPQSEPEQKSAPNPGRSVSTHDRRVTQPAWRPPRSSEPCGRSRSGSGGASWPPGSRARDRGAEARSPGTLPSPERRRQAGSGARSCARRCPDTGRRPLLFSSLLAADRKRALLHLDREIPIGEARHRQRDPVSVLAGAFDVVGRVGGGRIRR